MNAPDPKANTTTEAYLAYKAGYLEESELKPSLYEPYLHFDAWLAYWAGLTSDYPVTISKKNLFDINSLSATGVTISNGVASGTAQAFNTAFGTASGGIALSLDEGKYTISIEGYTDGNQATEATSGLAFRIGYSDGTYSSFIYWQNNDLSPVVKTITTESGKTPNSLIISFGANRQNTWHLSEIQLEKGSSATSYEPYATPEMLTDEEALVAYLSGVTDTYPEEIKDPYDVRIVGYLKHLVSVRWPEPDYPVNNEEFYLSTMEPTHTSNSEPSADIELDTAEGKIISLEAYGDTKQQTYTGKNLFDKNNVQGGNYYINSNQHTIFYGEGTYSCYIPIEAGATYTVSKMLTSRFAIATTQETPAPNVTTADDVVGNSSTSTSITLTASAGAKYLVVYFYRAASDTATIEEIEATIQIEKGPTATAYEPYVGGIPAPNPDYPQNVNIVTGRQEVNVEGKNLLNFESGTYGVSVTFTTGNATETHSSNSVTMEATGTVGAQYVRWITGELDSTKTYYLSFKAKKIVKGTDGGPIIQIIRYGSNDLSNWTNLSSTGTVVAMPEEGEEYSLGATLSGYKYYRLYIYNNAAAQVTVGEKTAYYDIQLEEGSTATPYEPYQGQSYEVNLGKNLLPITDGTTTSAGLTYTVNNGTVSISETSTAVSALNFTQTFPVKLKAGQTYTLSANNPVGSSDVILRLMDGNGNPLPGSALTCSSANSKLSITPSADTTELRGQLRINANATFDDFIVKPML